MSDPVDPTPTPQPPAPPNRWAPLKKLIPANWQQLVLWLILLCGTNALNWLTSKAPDPIAPVPTPPMPDIVYPDGWVEPTPEMTADTLAALESPLFFATDAGKAADSDDDAFLWKYAIKARGTHIPTRDQSSVGSCVSFGFACAVEYAMATQAHFRRGPPQDQVDVVQEVIYAGSRVEVNGGFAPIVGDGSTGAWAAKWISTGGLLKRGVYGNLDLTGYNTNRCRLWGRTGVPNELEPLAKQNLCTASLVKSASEAKKALQSGYPIAVCSNVGYASQPNRDADGFLKRSGRWAHCMCIIGYQGGTRPGFFIMNSWGENWVRGPLGKGDPPPGGFWADFASVDRMLEQGDSYAISNVKGFPKQKIDPSDWN